ncbi:hypothetical protein Sfum_1789 [Syntrophobacter fumaroxidans MPOB]|uniref:Uncharacterized protein n=1 Tax=Syntrophobacter fumaroxidans (strain DSM 10017 / MPOB) TaxID=335543 RepID=A0LJ74_SYNFM|nr:hypothetical protein Sfum_1789 [Syntrophobacter fumaroxidans MPOB]
MGKYQNLNVPAIMIERFAALAMAPPHGAYSHSRCRSLIVDLLDCAGGDFCPAPRANARMNGGIPGGVDSLNLKARRHTKGNMHL